ncbi:MAG: hypothetical protein WC461_01605 [Candidatus Paceibacterota bacterium]
MFKEIFSKGEKPEAGQQAAPAEEKRDFQIGPDGVVMTKKEAIDERKANLEDPTRRYDLK